MVQVYSVNHSRFLARPALEKLGQNRLETSRDDQLYGFRRRCILLINQSHVEFARYLRRPQGINDIGHFQIFHELNLNCENQILLLGIDYTV